MLGMLVLAGLLPSLPMKAQTQPQLNLMPWPSNVQPGGGRLRIDASFSVVQTGHTDARLDHAVQRFLRQLSRETGIPAFAKGAGSGKATLEIHTDHANKEIQELGEDESYVLEIGADAGAPAYYPAAGINGSSGLRLTYLTSAKTPVAPAPRARWAHLP